MEQQYDDNCWYNYARIESPNIHLNGIYWAIKLFRKPIQHYKDPFEGLKMSKTRLGTRQNVRGVFDKLADDRSRECNHLTLHNCLHSQSDFKSNNQKLSQTTIQYNV